MISFLKTWLTKIKTLFSKSWVKVSFSMAALGLISTLVFQNCAVPTHFSEMGSAEQLSVAMGCQADSAQSCTLNNGTGFQYCDPSGQWKTCQLDECDSGFYRQNDSCVPLACTPGAQTACRDLNGSGFKICHSDGREFGACQLNTCDVGFYLQNGRCLAQSCNPGLNIACSENNGVGNRTCNALGNGYGSCVLNSCNSGYYLNATGVCIAYTCTPNSEITCAENNGTGNKRCNAAGTGYGACILNSCNSGFNLQGGVCVANACNPNTPYECRENNGVGQRICNATGTGYGACTLSSCNPGYYLNGTNCMAQACAPGSETTCSEGNGTGKKICNVQGSGYSACTITSCNSGYNLQGGLCVINTCTPNNSYECRENNGVGQRFCNTTGTGYGACVLSSCDPGYNMNSSGICIAQACAPGSQKDCSEGNGTGKQTCNAMGTGHSACVLNTCNEGYVLAGGVCVLKVCTASETRICEGSTGIQSCNSAGTAWGICTPLNGQCGIASNSVTPAAIADGMTSFPPTQDLCSKGNPTSVIASQTQFSWSCLGLGAGSTKQDCTLAIRRNVACGSAHNTIVDGSIPNGSLCNKGNPNTPTLKSNNDLSKYYEWRCSSPDGQSTFCQASLRQNARCGPVHSTTSSSIMTDLALNFNYNSLCETGTPVNNAGIYIRVSGNQNQWSCSGFFGGSSVSCFQNLPAPIWRPVSSVGWPTILCSSSAQGTSCSDINRLCADMTGFNNPSWNIGQACNNGSSTPKCLQCTRY